MNFNLKEYLQQANDANPENGEFEQLLAKHGDEMKEYFYRMQATGITLIDGQLSKDQCAELFTHAAACIHDLAADLDLSAEDLMALMVMRMQSRVLISLVGMAIVFGVGLAAEEEWR